MKRKTKDVKEQRLSLMWKKLAQFKNYSEYFSYLLLFRKIFRDIFNSLFLKYITRIVDLRLWFRQGSSIYWQPAES